MKKMKGSKLWFVVLLMVVALVVTACGGLADSEPAATEEAMGDNSTAHETADDTMEEPMADDMMEESTGDEMMEESMDDDMMEEPTEEAMMEDETDEAMMDESTDGDMAETEGGEDMMMDENEILTLSFTGLENLGDGWAYEGWLIVDGQPVSTGVFTVDDQGQASATEFEVDNTSLATAALFVLTIEPSPDPDPAPSPIHILAGDFDGHDAQLSIAHPAALGTDFASTAGSSYILGIPTSDAATDSYTSGIWFTGLNLPELPEGWIYEGWIVGPDGPMSTGRFHTISEVDSDGAGPTAGPKAGPAFPGQDYLDPAIDLTDGYVVVISVEPDPDNSPAPFTLKPLVDMAVEDTGDHGDQEIGYDDSGFPVGTASR